MDVYLVSKCSYVYKELPRTYFISSTVFEKKLEVLSQPCRRLSVVCPSVRRDKTLTFSNISAISKDIFFKLGIVVYSDKAHQQDKLHNSVKFIFRIMPLFNLENLYKNEHFHISLLLLQISCSNLEQLFIATRRISRTRYITLVIFIFRIMPLFNLEFFSDKQLQSSVRTVGGALVIHIPSPFQPMQAVLNCYVCNGQKAG